MVKGPPAEVSIRPAVPADAPAIHDVSVASCRAAYADVLDDHTFLEVVEDPSRVSSLRERLADANTGSGLIYLVAEREESGTGLDTDGVVGFVQLLYGETTPEHVDDDDAFLRSLYVHPDRWGDGIGTALLTAARDRLPQATERITLGVLEANEIGRRFYEARGYEPVTERHFEIGDARYPTVVYAKSVARNGG